MSQSDICRRSHVTSTSVGFYAARLPVIMRLARARVMGGAGAVAGVGAGWVKG